MGMSASQARLLTLTARLHDIEYKAQKLEAEKLRLANNSTRVYEEYLNALDATKIQYSALTCDGSITYLDATLNAMENGVISGYDGETSNEILFLQNQDGAIIVTPAVAEKYNLVEGEDLGTLDEYLEGLDNITKSTREITTEVEVEDTDNIVGFTKISNTIESEPSSSTTYTYNPVENLDGSIDYDALSDYAKFGGEHTNTDNYITLSEATSVSGSTLEEGSTYAISTAEDLVKLAELVNSGVSTSGVTFVLTTDIDMSSVENWEGIGILSGIQTSADGANTDLWDNDESYAFEGTFDGNGYTISGLTGSQGLFGYTNGATIQNVALEGVNINSTDDCVGGLIGAAVNTDVENCYSTGSVKSSGDCVGGLIGYTYISGGNEITYSNLYSSVTVSGNDYVGGLLGYTKTTCMDDDTNHIVNDTEFLINNCFAIGNIEGNSYVGGFAGYMYYDEDNNDQDKIDINKCYAGGNVAGNNNVGGFVGGFTYWGDGDDWCNIQDCISAGKVNGYSSSTTGAFAGTIKIKNPSQYEDHSYVNFENCGYTENSGASSAYGSITDGETDVSGYVTNSGTSDGLVEYECVGTIPSISEEDGSGDYMQNIIAALTKAGVYSNEMDDKIKAFLKQFEDNKEDNTKLWYLNEAIVEYLNGTGSDGLGEALAQDILSGTTTATAEYQDGEELDGSILRGEDTIESAVEAVTESSKGEVTIPSTNTIAEELYYALKQAGYSIEESDVTTWINNNYSTSNADDKASLAAINDMINAEGDELSENLETLFSSINNNSKYVDTETYNTDEWNITVSSVNQTIEPEYGTKTETYVTGYEEYWDTSDPDIASAIAMWTMSQKRGFIIATEEQASSTTWLTNMLEVGAAVFTTFDITKIDELSNYTTEEIYNMSDAEYNDLMGIVNTSVATNTALREVSDETNLKKAEAKYEADMKKIDLKDRRYDTDLAAVETEREAIVDEIDTLKTVAKDNVDRTFKLFS